MNLKNQHVHYNHVETGEWIYCDAPLCINMIKAPYQHCMIHWNLTDKHFQYTGCLFNEKIIEIPIEPGISSNCVML